MRELRPRLPWPAWIVQAGGLTSAIGNGVVLPFIVIYLHDVRRFAVGTAALVVASLTAAAVFTTPVAGTLIDRVGARRVLALSLLLLTAGYGAFPFVHRPWQAFAAAGVAALGNGGMAPGYASLLAEVTPRERLHTAFGLRRMSDNLGVAIGAATGGIVVGSFGVHGYQALFMADAATFAVFAAMLTAVRPRRTASPAARGSYRDVLRRPLVVRLFVLNVLLVAAGYGTINAILPIFVRNDIGLSATWVGGIFVCNTLTVVLLQLPVARLLEGRRRMPAIALQSALWALSWLLVFLSGHASPAAVAGYMIAVAVTIFGVGEALAGALQRPLFADLAPPGLLGRYTALFDTSLRLGLTLGPALGALLFTNLGLSFWLVVAALCLAAGFATSALEPAVPQESRRTPRPLGDLARP